MKPTEFLKQAQAQYPQYRETLENIHSLYSQQLWFQLSQELDALICHKQQQIDEKFLQGLYEHFILDFYRKINLLKFAEFTVVTSQTIKDRRNIIKFLQDSIENVNKLTTQSFDVKVEKTYEPVLYIQMHIAQYKVAEEQYEEVKVLLEQGRKRLDSLKNVDPIVASSVFYAACLYHKAKRNYGEFYRNSLLFLCYKSSDQIAEEQRAEIATDICFASLLASDIYNFGELISHPIMDSIKTQHENSWLYELIMCCYQGDLDAYDQINTKYRKQIMNQPEMVTNTFSLKQKITILTLMQLISSRPPDQRKITLKDIGQKTKQDVDAVEFLIMKTLSLHLIEGVIDQVAQTVQVSWVQPRVMMHDQIQGLNVRLQGWLSKVQSTHTSFQEQSSELAEY